MSNCKIDLKCEKCPTEEYEGYFCRCENRNIKLVKQLCEEKYAKDDKGQDMNTKWTKYRDRLPDECDFPVIEWDEEFETSKLFIDSSEMGIKPRQSYIKQSLYWISVPDEYQPERSKREDIRNNPFLRDIPECFIPE